MLTHSWPRLQEELDPDTPVRDSRSLCPSPEALAFCLPLQVPPHPVEKEDTAPKHSDTEWPTL